MSAVPLSKSTETAKEPGRQYERVLEKLGIAVAPALDFDGLRTVYSAWCMCVPFDNVAKQIALLTSPGGLLPAISANAFFDRFLVHGAGGTCWTSSDALFTLLDALGFNARRAAGSMRDTGIISHGTVKVRIDTVDWLADSSMLTNRPVPLTQNVFISDDPVFSVEVDPVDETHVVWADLPPNSEYLACRLLVDDASEDFYQERWQASLTRSPFNDRIYARRNRPGEILVLSGNRRFSKTASGLQSEDLSAPAICECLRDEIGISSELLDTWRDSGALSASLLPPSGDPPPPSPGLRPSLVRRSQQHPAQVGSRLTTPHSR